jgi:hypothetical protein
MSGEQAGHKKNCFKCNTKMVYVVNGDNLQWQNEADGKPHYTFVSEKNYKCNLPVAPETKPETKSESNTITVNTPFDEAELIARWAGERAYKIVMADVDDYSRLSPQEKSGLGQKEGMYTRLLTDTVLELMKLHNIKTKYPGEK